MKNNVFNVLLLLLFSAVLSTLYQPSAQLFILILGGSVSYAALRLLPNRIAAVAAALCISLGMCIFDARYVSFVLPAVCAAAALYAAQTDAGTPAKKDGLFCTAALAAAASDAVSVIFSLSGLRASPFCTHPFGRYDLFAAGCAISAGFLLLRAARAGRETKKKKDRAAGKRTAAYALTLAAVLTVLLFWFKQVANLWSFLWPAFMCVYAAFTIKAPAAAEVPAKRQKEKRT